ncbi:DUF4249 family protein [Schleiferia thermophila]|jgi:hypothetical protein|uniref:DUF4249 family protein n=1 Tax=Schleiferia thermophila TaxID=884107 RepID=UPI0005694AC6|nr:DUF4249 family protein [Schleiferia thermophila]
MKKLVYLLILIMGIAACETIIDLDIQFDDKQMAVSAIFWDQRNPGDSTVCVWVSDVLHPLAKNTSRIILTDAEVSLFENGQFVENLQPIIRYKQEYNWQNNQIDTIKFGYFKSHHPLTPGYSYKITANRPGKKEVTHFYIHPPRVIPTSVKLTKPEKGEVTITFDNPKGIQQFLVSLKSSTNRTEYFSSIDPHFQIFRSSNLDDSEDEPGAPVVGRYGILYDKNSQPRSQQQFTFYIRDFDSQNLSNYSVEFGAVSESFPLYIASYLAFINSENTLSTQPEVIYSNASKGLGISMGLNTGNYNIQP